MTAAGAAQPQQARVFSLTTPDLGERKRKLQVMARTDIALCALQAVREGGENNLHSHTTLDGFWIVLSGRARFYTTDDVLVADLGPREGVLIPRGYPYWFESAGEENLEILQFEAAARGLGEDVNFDRVDHKPRKFAPGSGGLAPP